MYENSSESESDYSSLLCQEDSVDDPVADNEDHQKTGKALSFGNGGSEPTIALPCLSEEKFSLMIEQEKSLLPRHDYLERLRTGDLDMSVRRQALDWISKARAHHGFGEWTFYLAINYLDRFLSSFELPGGRNWAVQLLAVTCLSLGAKMAEIDVPAIMDLQVGEPKFVFEARTIRRMELLVLSSLKWRMLPCTPYSFIDYLLRKMMIGNGGGGGDDDDKQPPAIEALMGKAVKLISCTIKGIDFLEFKPSEVAAAVAMVVAGETPAIDVEKAMSCFIQIEKERVVKCHNLLQDLTLMMKSGCIRLPNTATRPSDPLAVPHSPDGVLEAASSLSYQTDERTVGSCPNSSDDSPDTKKKKMDTTSSSFGNSNNSPKS